MWLRLLPRDHPRNLFVFSSIPPSFPQFSSHHEQGVLMPGAAASLVLNPVCACGERKLRSLCAVGLACSQSWIVGLQREAQHHICSVSREPCTVLVLVIWKPDLSFRVRTVRLSCSYHAQSRRRRLLCSNQIDWNARPQPGNQVRSAQFFSRLSAGMSEREAWTHCGLRTYQSDWRRKQQWGQRSSKKTAQPMGRLLAKQSKRLYSPSTKFFVVE